MNTFSDFLLRAHPELRSFWYFVGENEILGIFFRFTLRNDDVADLSIERQWYNENHAPVNIDKADVDTLLYVAAIAG